MSARTLARNAACTPHVRAGRDYWYADDSDTLDGFLAQQTALRICAGCPVQALCRTTVMEEEHGRNRHGIRAGLFPGERISIARGRRPMARRAPEFEHGCRTGFQWHAALGETPCGPCQAAEDAVQWLLQGPAQVAA